MKRKIVLLALTALTAVMISGCCLSHEWQDATCEMPKTCTKCGESEGEALGHSWEAATCEQMETCSSCGKTQGEALGHSWEAATCEVPETCAVCGETQGEPLNHVLRSHSLNEDPETGEITHIGTCSVCKAENCVISYADWDALAFQWTVGRWEFSKCIAVAQLDNFIPDEMVGDSFVFREDGTAEFVFEGKKDTGTWRYLDTVQGVLGNVVWGLFESSEGKRCQFWFNTPDAIGWSSGDMTLIMTYQKVSENPEAS